MFPVRRQINRHASHLRQNMTDVERKLWEALRNRQLENFKFRRQATVGPFVVDFLCIEARLVIELDGGQHNEPRDYKRTIFLEGKGLRILRFWNHEVLTNFDGVTAVIQTALLEEKKTLTQPSIETRVSVEPAKAGEG